MIDETEDYWWDRFSDWLLERISDFLLFLFPERTSSLDVQQLSRWLRYLIYGIVLFGGGIVVYYFLSIWLTRSGFVSLGSLAARESDVPKDPIKDLASEMRRALEKGDIPRAARLRWKLFLRRRGVSQDVTPWEFLTQFRIEPATHTALGLSLIEECNRLMFAGEASHVVQFQKMDEVLVQMENRGDQGDQPYA